VQSNISSQLGKIIMVANFRRVKNQIFALEVLQALGPHYSLDLYGMIDEQDYYDEVMQSIKEKGLSQQVNIIKGRTDIYEVLPPYEFALHTASKETGPLVLLEYMNVGLPFFTYNTGDVVNKVKQLLPELILEDLEVSQWVQRIHEVCNKERRADLKNHMDVIINMNYTEEKYWESLNAIYTKTLQAV
jgi:glycosyltransferase involved in cell wall biosynthesis